jgi:hypothetical protein
MGRLARIVFFATTALAFGLALAASTSIALADSMGPGVSAISAGT